MQDKILKIRELDPFNQEIPEMAQILVEDLQTRTIMLDTELGRSQLKTMLETTFMFLMQIGYLARDNQQQRQQSFNTIIN
jgi:hypothetical protein